MCQNTPKPPYYGSTYAKSIKESLKLTPKGTKAASNHTQKSKL
jgi:hypothetical protein